MDNKEKTQPPKELWEIYNINDFIDAKDNQSDWRVGFIIQKNINTRFFKVRFDGWGTKYDQYYRFTSPKLAAFRSIVVGYTGQKKNPGIRNDWKFSLKNHTQRQQMFKDFTSSNSKTAWQINQFFRGHNYLYTDFLMTETYDTIQQMTAVMNYFIQNVKLVVRYLKTIDPEFKKYYRSQEIPEESHLVDPEAAMVNSYYQLMDTLYTISGSYSRLETFYSKNAALIRKYLNIDFEKNVKRYYQLKILEQVMLQDGFTILQQLIEKKLQSTKCLIPFLFLKSISALYIGLSNQVQYKEKKKFLDMLVEITRVNLQKLDEKYLKDINKAHIVDLLQTLKGGYENTDDQQTIRNWALNQQVKFYQKMVTCPYFDKKLKGVIGFQQLAQKNKMQPYAGQFIQVLLNNKIFESLFAFDNAEIIRKSVEFCKSLYFNEMFPLQMAFKIWELRQGKHEAALQQIYALFSVLPSKFSHSQFEKKLFDEISKQPKQQWDEDYIKMIRQFSLTAVGWAKADQKSPEKYGFDILYNYAIQKKTDYSIQSFIQLLTRFEKTQIMNEFIEDCFNKIGTVEDSLIYVTLLLKIVDENISEFKQISSKASSVVIKDLMRNSNDSLQRNIKRFQLLTQVTKLTNTNISFEQFMDLWKQFKNKPSLKAYQDWILNKKDADKSPINTRIGTDIRREIFQEIWNEGYDFENMEERQAQLFIQFFKATNTIAGKLKRLNFIIKTEDLQLIGIDRIWQAFQVIKVEKIASNLAELIVQLHMCPTKSQQLEKQAWTKILIQLFSKKIMEAYKQKNLHKVKRLLLIPSKIIERDEQIFIPKPTKNYIMKEYKVINKSTKQQKLIKFNYGGVTYDFKKLVAEKFKVPFKKCKLTCKNELIKYENYFKSMFQCNFSNSPFEIQVIQQDIPSVKKYLNSQLEIFFTLLGDPQLERKVWEIIQRLPIAQDQLKKLQSSEHPWEQINNPSIYKELYIMRVMTYMDNKWWATFCSGPGLLNLTKKISRVTAKAKVERQYLKILYENIENCPQIAQPSKQINLQLLTLSLLKSLNDLLDNCAEETQGRKNSVQVSIVSSIFNISHIISSEVNLFQILLQKYENKIDLLEKGLIKVKNEHIRKQFTLRLKQASKKIKPQNIESYLKIIYKNIFDLATSYPNPQQISQYFEYASDLVDLVETEQFQKYLKSSQNQIIKLVERGLYQQKSQLTAENLNYQLLGFLMLMKRLVRFCSIQQKQRITQFLIYKCFFPHLTSNKNDVICKCKQSKTAAFQLLASLIRENRNSLKAIDILTSLHKNALWRTRKLQDWTLTPGEKIKSSSGYVGIKNLGCICYMNSLFQQIFMIPDFRQAILQCQDPLEQKEVPTQNVLYQVKKMFYSLLHSDTKYYIPNEFCQAFKNYEGQPTNVFQQMDIDEFSNILFDRLQTQIKGTAYENIIKDFFGGVFSNQIICKGCPHFSQTQESFLSISLNVKSKKNIYQSFDAMIKGDTLDGDNAYFCQRCNKKVPAVKRVCLKKLPDHLILTLKRFQFDYETMNKIKLNDYCQFPTELNVKEYSQQHLRKQQNPDRFDEQQMLPDSYYDYNLQGVVIHIGHADSGHYFSYIKQPKNQGKWFQFNDTIVRPFDIKKLSEQAFGGQTGTIEIKQKIKNAYMLIYERKKKIVNHDKLIKNQKDIDEYPIYSKLKEQIKHMNIIQKIESIVFSHEYTKFASSLIKYVDKMEPETAISALKYIVLVYLTVIIREKQEAPAFNFLRDLHKVLNNYPVLIDWLAGIFTAQKSLTQFFKNNPAKQVKKLMAYWVASIVQKANEQTKNKFIDGLLAFMINNGQNTQQFCQILFELMEDLLLCDYIAKKHVIAILCENMLGKEKSIFKNTDGFTIVQDAESEIGKEKVIQKSAHQLSKKPKINQETQYVWGVIARVIQYAEAQGKILSQVVTKQQMDLMFQVASNTYKIMEQCKSKFMIKKFSTILAHLARDNQKFTQQIINFVSAGFKSFISKAYRQLIIILNRVSMIDDNDVLSSYRAKKALDAMIKALKQNEKFSLDTNLIMQWIIKSLRKNPKILSALLDQGQYLKYLIQTTGKKQPTEQLCRKHSTYTEATVNKLHGIKMLKNKKRYEVLAKKMEKFYVQLIEQKKVDANQWDSDDDLTEKTVKPGDTVAFFDQKEKLQFLEAKVEQNLLSRLTIVVNKSKECIWKDDQRLTSSNYPFQEIQSEQQDMDSQNTTQMEYDDGYI